MSPEIIEKKQKVFRRLGFALPTFWTTMYYTRTNLEKIQTPKTFRGTQSKNLHAKVWKVFLENTTTWKIKSSTSSLDLCAPTKLTQITVWKQSRWSRNPVWPLEYTRMVQLWKIWKDVNQLWMRVLSPNSDSYGISFKT